MTSLVKKLRLRIIKHTTKIIFGNYHINFPYIVINIVKVILVFMVGNARVNCMFYGELNGNNEF